MPLEVKQSVISLRACKHTRNFCRHFRLCSRHCRRSQQGFHGNGSRKYDGETSEGVPCSFAYYSLVA